MSAIQQTQSLSRWWIYGKKLGRLEWKPKTHQEDDCKHESVLYRSDVWSKIRNVSCPEEFSCRCLSICELDLLFTWKMKINLISNGYVLMDDAMRFSSVPPVKMKRSVIIPVQWIDFSFFIVNGNDSLEEEVPRFFICLHRQWMWMWTIHNSILNLHRLRRFPLRSFLRSILRLLIRSLEVSVVF